jgi:HK97 family phage prohead protease
MPGDERETTSGTADAGQSKAERAFRGPPFALVGAVMTKHPDDIAAANGDIGAFFAPFEIKFVDPGNPGAFEGYGSVFNNVDSHGDLILPGAFAESLAQHRAKGTMPGMYVEHGPWVGGDPLPAGAWGSIEEDAHGLKVAGKISALETDYGRRVRALMQDGALGGLSIAYQVPPGGAVKGRNPGEPSRTLKRVNLHSIDIVRDPSNAGARISSVKTFASQVDMERFFRSNGVARGAAAKIAAVGWPALVGGEDTDPKIVAAELATNTALAALATKIDSAVLELKTIKRR